MRKSTARKRFPELYYRDHSNYYYRLWQNIKDRCYNPNNIGYHNYGGRGITLYEPWKTDFESFVDYLLIQLGTKPKKYTLDRIENNGSYVPFNLRWATMETQCSNRRTKEEVLYDLLNYLADEGLL
jgi:hypothetical protein